MSLNSYNDKLIYLKSFRLKKSHDAVEIVYN